MIEKLSDYAFSLVSAIFVLNIIQMVLPENKNRKYVLFVSSMIITIILIEPVLNFLNEDIEVSNVLSENQEKLVEISEETKNKYYEQEILKKYKENIENGIIDRLTQMGYETKVIKCEYNQTTLEPEYLYLELNQIDGEIIPVKIEVMQNPQNKTNEFSLLEKIQIKETLKSEYGIKNMEVVKWIK